MPKSKSIKEDGDVLVTHAQLRSLVGHLAARFTAIEARLDECERTRPVDPAVKEAGDALIADVRRSTAHMERALMLVPDSTEEGADGGGSDLPSKESDDTDEVASKQRSDVPPQFGTEMGESCATCDRERAT